MGGVAEELGALRLTAVAVNVSMEVARDGGGQDGRSQKSPACPFHHNFLRYCDVLTPPPLTPTKPPKLATVTIRPRRCQRRGDQSRRQLFLSFQGGSLQQRKGADVTERPWALGSVPRDRLMCLFVQPLLFRVLRTQKSHQFRHLSQLACEKRPKR